MERVMYIKEWLDTLDEEDLVGIDDGGLALRGPGGAYYEIGGIPLEEEEDELWGDWGCWMCQHRAGSFEGLHVHMGMVHDTFVYRLPRWLGQVAADVKGQA